MTPPVCDPHADSNVGTEYRVCFGAVLCDSERMDECLFDLSHDFGPPPERGNHPIPHQRLEAPHYAYCKHGPLPPRPGVEEPEHATGKCITYTCTLIKDVH